MSTTALKSTFAVSIYTTMLLIGAYAALDHTAP
jgi:hypothetical protein